MSVDSAIVLLNEERGSAKDQIKIRLENIQENCKKLENISNEQKIKDIADMIWGLSRVIEHWLEEL